MECKEEAWAIDDAVDKILCRMTLDERIDQLSGWRGLHGLLPWTYRLAAFSTPDNRRLSINGLRFTDGPRGINLGRSTCFPAAIARGATFDPDLEFRVGAAMAQEAWHQGANAAGCTCINLIRHPGWGRAQESFGADPFLLGRMGASLVKGLQTRVIAVVKHFALNSIENTRFKVNVLVDERSLREIYLPQFNACIDAGASCIMAAYNKVRGLYCSENAHLLSTILRQEWGFDGFVMSDFFLGCRSTGKALNAGLDMEMPQRFYFSRGAMKRALRKGEIREADIDRAVKRILRVKHRFGLLLQKKDDRRPDEVVACHEHTDLALEAARKAIVLLRNRGGALPIRPGEKSIVVIGKMAARANLGSTGSADVRPPWAVPALEALKSLPGLDIQYFSDTGSKKARHAMKHSDHTLVFTGIDPRDEGEYYPFLGGGDRLKLELRSRDESAIMDAAACSKKTTIILFGGSAIACGNWAESVDAILMAWYPGMQGGTAIAETLTGRNNPSGKLPVSFPSHTGQLPRLSRERTVHYDLMPDYRYFDFQGIEPLFPFGHGLSYSTFSLHDLRLSHQDAHPSDTVIISADVCNHGPLDGETVVQLYCGASETRISPRSQKELKAFRRVFVRAGERIRVDIPLAVMDLAIFDTGSGNFTVEPAKYTCRLGLSSRDLSDPLMLRCA